LALNKKKSNSPECVALGLADVIDLHLLGGARDVIEYEGESSPGAVACRFVGRAASLEEVLKDLR